MPFGSYILLAQMTYHSCLMWWFTTDGFLSLSPHIPFLTIPPIPFLHCTYDPTNSTPTLLTVVWGYCSRFHAFPETFQVFQDFERTTYKIPGLFQDF